MPLKDEGQILFENGCYRGYSLLAESVQENEKRDVTSMWLLGRVIILS
jgi:hypothetical protein